MDYKQLADAFIDNYCDAFGVKNCIRYLLDMGYSEQEIEELGFDIEDHDCHGFHRYAPGRSSRSDLGYR